MDISYALVELKNERAVIDGVIARLERMMDAENAASNRPSLAKRLTHTAARQASANDAGRTKQRRQMTPEHKRKISEALKARAAAQKKSAA